MEPYNDTWIIEGKEFTFQDRQNLYNFLLAKGMIKEKPELTVDDLKKKESGIHYCNEKCKQICPLCHDTGIIKKTEWIDTDISYEVEITCECQKQ